MRNKGLVLLVCSVLALYAISVFAQGTMETTAQITTVPIMTHPSQGDMMEIEGATATLLSTEEGIAIHFATNNLEENHAYTMWVAMINNPGACSVRPCPGPETLINSDLLQTEMTQGSSLLYSEKALMVFTAFVLTGDVSDGWFGNGLTNPMGAEIHIVIMDHGELISDMAAEMLNTTRGGCTDESVPPPYPDNAKADGEPGPNTCRGMQLAIIQQ